MKSNNLFLSILLTTILIMVVFAILCTKSIETKKSIGDCYDDHGSKILGLNCEVRKQNSTVFTYLYFGCIIITGIVGLILINRMEWK